MRWEEVKPEQKGWQRQWNLTAYYGSHIIGSIIIGTSYSMWVKTAIQKEQNIVN